MIYFPVSKIKIWTKDNYHLPKVALCFKTMFVFLTSVILIRYKYNGNSWLIVAKNKIKFCINSVLSKYNAIKKDKNGSLTGLFGILYWNSLKTTVKIFNKF